MNKFLNIIILIILFSSIATKAQQNPHYTQYMYNMNIINPAYAGARADMSIGLLGRSQWVGLDGAPETESFSINARVFDGIGLGLSAVQDKIGLFESTNVNLDVSYTLALADDNRLAFGLKLGFSSFSNKLADGVTPDGEVYASLSDTNPNAGIGAFFYNSKFYGGLSIPYLLETPQFRLDSATDTNGLSKNANVFLTAGMVFELNDKVKFKPSTLVKYVNSLPLSIDLNTNFLYDERFEAGLSYRYNDSVSGLFAIIINKNFRVGYTYDYTLGNLSEYNSGSHEIMLLWDIDFAKNGRWLKNSSCYF